MRTIKTYSKRAPFYNAFIVAYLARTSTKIAVNERSELFAPFELTPPSSFLLTRPRISITL